MQVVALPASVLGVCDEVLSSLGFLPCRAITPPESAYYSVFPGDSSRFRAIESRSESPPEMPIYSITLLKNFKKFPPTLLKIFKKLPQTNKTPENT